jgi:hypothetical protein
MKIIGCDLHARQQTMVAHLPNPQLRTRDPVDVMRSAGNAACERGSLSEFCVKSAIHGDPSQRIARCADRPALVDPVIASHRLGARLRDIG